MFFSLFHRRGKSPLSFATQKQKVEYYITYLCSASSELDKTPSCGDTDKPFTSLHKLVSSAIYVKQCKLRIFKNNKRNFYKQ